MLVIFTLLSMLIDYFFKFYIFYVLICVRFYSCFGGACWSELYHTSVYPSSFGLIVKLIAESMFIPSRWFIVVMYQSKKQISRLMKLTFLALQLLLRLLRGLGGSRRLNHRISVCACEVYRWACNAFSSSNNLRDSALLCDAEAATLGPSCHHAGELLAPRSDFPRQRHGECEPERSRK